MSCLLRCPYFRGVLNEGFHCIQQYHDWCKSCEKVRYRNNGFLELVCICGTDAACCGQCTRPARANSVSYIIVTHF